MPDQTQEILTRGVEQILPNRDSLAALMQERPLKVYIGIDPTGSLLTLGHSVGLRKLQQFADAGHEAILLVGNGTVRIGDPTGKDSTRPELTDDIIQENFKNWQAQASKVLDFSKIKILHNGDWLDRLTYLDMVKLLSKTTVQQLLERDMFQRRIEEGRPIYGHEIIYPLLQGFDSVAMDVDLEIGGSDQLFNMMSGRTLQREYNHRDKWVMTVPIIPGTDGRKMSKSYNNYIALTENPNDMYGKLMSVADELIVQYFELLTDVPTEEIQSIKAAIDAGENPMQFKKRLAFTITEFYHDPDAAGQAQEHFEKTVQDREVPTDIPTITVETDELPLLELLKKGLPEESSNNLRRLVEQRAVTLLPSNTQPTDITQIIATAEVAVVKVGKRRYFKVARYDH